MEDFSTERVLRNKPNWWREFPPPGEGTITFDMQRCTPFCVVIRTADTNYSLCETQWISLEVKKNCVFFKMHMENGTKVIAERRGKTERDENIGFEDWCKLSYWLSYDCNNLVIKYGKGYRMNETTILECDLLAGLTHEQQVKERGRLHRLFSSKISKVIEQYDMAEQHTMIKMYAEIISTGTTVHDSGLTLDSSEVPPTTKKICLETISTVGQSNYQQKAEEMARALIDLEGMVDFDRSPLTCNWPPLVLDSSKVTLLDLDSNNYTFSASLPIACRELYQNVAHSGVCLDMPFGHEQYKLSDAIRHSIETEDGVLHKKLEEKAGKFGAKNKAYLRVTLGMCRGNSPGIPYVLEIWPKNHGSPIHSHGNSYAVIKVIHGGLTISIYNKHIKSENDQSLLDYDVKQGDVTWISPNWYQTHKLWNNTSDYCITIQCYQYGDNDHHHWPYFSYISSKGTSEEFLPTSDFTFREMRAQVLKEYQNYLAR